MNEYLICVRKVSQAGTGPYMLPSISSKGDVGLYDSSQSALIMWISDIHIAYVFQESKNEQVLGRAKDGIWDRT